MVDIYLIFSLVMLVIATVFWANHGWLNILFKTGHAICAAFCIVLLAARAIELGVITP
tara:strand:- start:5259 stop:5432 length:174 start_codon:yes stop_codon:yes gene_type:complete